MALCGCGSGCVSDECCSRYLKGDEDAPTAEALMRSRYHAFVVKDASYLLRTWHPSTRPRALDFDGDTTTWLKLEVLETISGGKCDTRGIVEFKAYFDSGTGREILHERSSFLKEDGAWFYVDGEMPQQSSVMKPSRNKPCPCGSGKKYKRCCG